MNYQGIVNWLQEDDFVIIGFTTLGESALMEKETGREVSDLPAFLIASVLPVAKRKVAYELIKGGATSVTFEEKILPMRPNDVEDAEVIVEISVPEKFICDGRGKTGEYATVNAIENFIKKQKEKNERL